MLTVSGPLIAILSNRWPVLPKKCCRWLQI